MRTIWRSLAWKEWHEHKWKLVSIAAILLGIASTQMLDGDREMLMGVRVGIVLSIVPLAIFVGLGIAAGERSRGTLAFLQALPVPMWRVALHKLAFGMIAIIVPAVIAITVAFAFAYMRYKGLIVVGAINAGDVLGYSARADAPFRLGISNWYAETALVITMVAGSFFIWTSAAGVNRRDEVSAGAIALAVMVGWCVLLSWIGYQLHRLDGPLFHDEEGIAELLAITGVSTAPGGVAVLTDMPKGGKLHYIIVGFVTAAITHAGLASWYIRRFGTIAEREVRSPQAAVADDSQLDWLPPPRRSTVTAIAWKQFRESGPIVLAGMAGTIAVAMIIFFIEPGPAEKFPRLLSVYGPVSMVLGSVISLVIGIGVLYYEMTPQMNTFWRSRPINPDAWFWSKFLTGLVILFTSIYVPILLIAAFSEIVWGDVHILDARVFRVLEPQILLIPTLQAALFASAVAMIGLVRHAVYAAILSIAAMYLSVLAGGAAWMSAGLLGWVELNRDWWEPTEMAIVVGFLTSFVISTIVAWLAVRNDWGWKSRY